MMKGRQFDMLNTTRTRRIARVTIPMVSQLTARVTSAEQTFRAVISAQMVAAAQKARVAFMQTPTIILAAALILLAYSPRPAIAQGQPSGVINVSLKGDRLAFASIADYKRAVDEPSEKTKKRFLGTVAALKGFTSFGQKQDSLLARQTTPGNTLLIQDEYFAAILNTDLVVQIGDYIFRVNPSSERVYALPVANKKEYADLIAENTRNPNIRTFSTNDDVLDVIKGGGKGPEALSCHETGIGSYHREAQVGNSQTGLQKANVDFARYGIYFTLFAWLAPANSSFPSTFEFTGGIAANQGYVYYHVRCGNTASYAISLIPSVDTNKQQQKYQSYQGSKTLNEVYFFYRIKFHPSFWIGPSTPLYSPYVGIRVNI
jgi:hypothetical protein